MTDVLMEKANAASAEGVEQQKVKMKDFSERLSFESDDSRAKYSARGIQCSVERQKPLALLMRALAVLAMFHGTPRTAEILVTSVMGKTASGAACGKDVERSVDVLRHFQEKHVWLCDACLDEDLAAAVCAWRYAEFDSERMASPLLSESALQRCWAWGNGVQPAVRCSDFLWEPLFKAIVPKVSDDEPCWMIEAANAADEPSLTTAAAFLKALGLRITRGNPLVGIRDSYKVQASRYPRLMTAFAAYTGDILTVSCSPGEASRGDFNESVNPLAAYFLVPTSSGSGERQDAQQGDSFWTKLSPLGKALLTEIS